MSVSGEKKVICKTDIESIMYVQNHIPFREEEICTCRTFITDGHNTHYIHEKAKRNGNGKRRDTQQR